MSAPPPDPPCCVCGAHPAPFGFRAVKGRAGDWYCVAHRSRGEETASRPVEERDIKRAPPPPRQGRLL